MQWKEQGSIEMTISSIWIHRIPHWTWKACGADILYAYKNYRFYHNIHCGKQHILFSILLLIADHRFSFNLWDPHTTPAPPSPADGDDTTLYSNPAYYDCDQSASTKSPSIRKSLYYDVSSIMNPAAADGHYEIMDFDTHYETASNFQFELPALPYEVPTPSVSL